MMIEMRKIRNLVLVNMGNNLNRNFPGITYNEVIMTEIHTARVLYVAAVIKQKIS